MESWRATGIPSMFLGPPWSWSDGGSYWYHCKPGKLLVRGQEKRLGPWGSCSSLWHLSHYSWPMWGHKGAAKVTALSSESERSPLGDYSLPPLPPPPLLVGCIFSAFFLNFKKAVCECTQKVLCGSGNNCMFPHSPRWCHLFSSSELAAVKIND